MKIIMEKFFHISVHHNKNIAGRGGDDHSCDKWIFLNASILIDLGYDW